MPRRDLRRADQLRPVRIERGYQRYADGSALIETGHTHGLGDGGVLHAPGCGGGAYGT